MGIAERLVARRNWRLARLAAVPLNLSVPAEVRIGNGLQLVHYGFGTVIYPEVTIGDRVRIYQQVTIGRKDAHIQRADSDERGDPGQRPSDDQGVDLCGALVGEDRLHIAEDLPHLPIDQDAVAAHELAAQRSGLARHL